MTKDVKYQVFVSSTFTDLQDERRRLMEQILNLGHIPVGMELFHAGNDQQWTYIKRRIASCDYYLLIVAERYGSLDSDGKSFTQKEFEFAASSGIPIASFLLHDDARDTRPAKFVEQHRRAEIDYLRTLCSADRMVTFWNNPDELALKATNALLGLIEEEPRLGWVRADQSSEAAFREVAKLAQEKRELEAQVAALGSPVRVVPADVAYHLDKMNSLNVSAFQQGFEFPHINSFAPLDLVDIFIKLSRELAVGTSRPTIAATIVRMCRVETDKDPSFFRFPYLIISEFAAYGLIRVMVGEDANGFSQTMCTMLEYGIRVLMYAEQQQEKLWNEEADMATSFNIGDNDDALKLE